ncbi:MAG: agmatine deiminase family protein [Pseudomonadota bacterium]
MNSTDYDIDPRDFGYYMPAEWTLHSGCWMAWPCREGMWEDETATAQDYANVANAIARFEPVKMVTPAHKTHDARQLLNDSVEIVELPIDDSWTRDNGPNFLIGGDALAGSDWVFNAWGEKYSPYDQDARLAERILDRLGARRFPSWLVAEGGGITVDGEGTVITTASCYLNKNRNPGVSKKDIERELCRTLGAEKVLWIPGDVEETETDGHIDGIAAFIEPGRVLVQVNPDKTDPHYSVGMENVQALSKLTDAKGRRLELEFIDEGIYHPGTWNGGCSSYINSYLANNAVIVPAYGYDRDASCVETYQRLYPERTVVQVPINNIAVGGGGIHCITQQQPQFANDA